MKKIEKKQVDPELEDYCEGCLRIRNRIFDSSVASRENDIPHTCCDVNDEASKERIAIDIEIAELLKMYEEGINKKMERGSKLSRSLK